jgi:DNA polymerase
MKNVVFIDYETYWSVDHTLTKMNPITYVMHPDTEIQSIAIKWNKYPTDVFFGEGRIRALLEKHQRNGDFDDAMIVAHNGSGFDHLISAWRFGIKPKAWGCTLAMSRPFYGVSVGGSLKKVSAALGLGMKGDLETINTKGKRLNDFTSEQIAAMREYNRQDTELCAGIFYALAPRLSVKELKLIDLATRMTVEEKFEADVDLLRSTLTRVQAEKRQRLLELYGVSKERGLVDTTTSATPEEAVRSVVMSQMKFSTLLQALGADVPMKPSKTSPNTMIPALAKTDKGMEALLEHEDETVALAAAVRLETKSTQLETRLQTYINVAQARGGKLPMPVNYCGAAISWRMSGGMKMNVQNMPRVARHPKGHALAGQPTDKPHNSLRLALKAPKGKKIVVVDSSNIELRVAHKLAGELDTIEKLRNREDLYCWFASDLFGRTITKADEDERFIGKVAMLSLQYGASWKSFQNMARVLSGGKTDLSEDECKRIVKIWRTRFHRIAGKEGIWKQCDRAIEAMGTADTYIFSELDLFTALEQLITPNNHWLQYPDLHSFIDPNTGYTQWEYGQGQNKSRIHGAHLFENICQHLARNIVMEQTLVLDKMYPGAVALSCHDEADLVVDEDMAEQCREDSVRVFSTSPSWWPDLPLAAEAGIGDTYGAAK